MQRCRYPPRSEGDQSLRGAQRRADLRKIVLPGSGRREVPMPSTSETTAEHARAAPDTVFEERAHLADEAPPAETLIERAPSDSPFEDGVSDAWGSGWPIRR